ncbi:MAG: aminodeoxychorismate synthase component I [Planctomycetes bacterium]|nr:aminodeoxychorismate synthase component I [Planctomycetota bacterium]
MSVTLQRAIAVPAVVELPAGITAASVCARLADLPHLLWLDSALGGPLGRYSFVTADPTRRLTPTLKSQPLDMFEHALADWRMETIAGLPPFQGGAAGLFGYELSRSLEELSLPDWDDLPTPPLAVGIYDWVIGFDHAQDRAWIISTGYPEKTPSRRRLRAQQRLERVCDWLEREPIARTWRPQTPARVLSPHVPLVSLPGVFTNLDRGSYLRTIRRAIDYIHAGDCFQVNIAQRLLTPALAAPWDVYEKLRQRNPAPFAGYFDLGEFVIASASPERFLKVVGNEVETRPIKGTRPRGVGPEEDLLRADELQISDKDRAENVMIVDLLRNDLGRVCRYGSVHVESLCRVESFRTVHHLVSEVRGTLRHGLGPVDLLKAAFPGGSITGAPKIRAMEIITELEQTARGPYCGCLGYVGFDASMDTNLLIRTFTIGKGWMQFPVGGGIVADSDPEAEYEETWHKAEGLLRALS